MIKMGSMPVLNAVAVFLMNWRRKRRSPAKLATPTTVLARANVFTLISEQNLATSTYRRLPDHADERFPQQSRARERGPTTAVSGIAEISAREPAQQALIATGGLGRIAGWRSVDDQVPETGHLLDEGFFEASPQLGACQHVSV